MNLIDAYVSEVGRRLLPKQRADIGAEIRSAIQDMVDERAQKSGKPVDDELILAVLKEYGDPEKVAGSYLPERYLVGPRLYPLFTLVVRIVLSVIGVLALIALGIALGHSATSAQAATETVLHQVGQFVASAMSALGNIVLIFAVVEWALYRSGETINLKGALKGKEWDPRSLAKVSPSSQVKLVDTIIEIVGSFAAIVIFDFYPQIIALGFTSHGSWTFLPLLSQAFFGYVPYLTLVWAATIVVDIFLLRMGRWTILTRVLVIVLKGISLVIAIALLAGPSLIAVTVPALTSALGDAEAARILMTVLMQGVRVALWLAILGSGIEIIRLIYRTVAGSLQP